ncbi:chromate transporter [Bacteroidia bacterium]|nr:chromate transporter [Bacteroidia bacterium]
MIYRQLFGSFFKIGAFTLGGGYAMIPLVEREMVHRRKWLSAADFVDLLTVAQSAPGVLAVNMAIFAGYRVRGMRGGLVAALATVLPSFVIMLLIAMLFVRYGQQAWVTKVMLGVRPAVVALIAWAVVSTAKTAGVTLRTIAIPIAVALLVWGLGVSPVYIVVAFALGGIVKKIVTKS